jgi:endonuclease/exonuclease/phosphatase (EEP) superfamily protein YafD
VRPPKRGLAARAAFAGAAGALSAVALAGAAVSWAYPTGGVLGPLARVLDALAPALVLAGLVLALLALGLGLRRLGLLLVVVALAAGWVGVEAYRAVTAPPAAGAADLRILFFNARYREARTGEAVVDAILQADADVVVVAEAQELGPAAARFDAAYGFVSPCNRAECEILVAVRRPVRRFWRLQLNPVWSDRYAVAELELETGERLFVSAVHLVKPWMSGLAEGELGQLQDQYAWFDGPVVAVGDFNMTPWNRPLRDLLAATGFRAVRGQFGTWPASAGTLGFPIDHVLVRDGVRVTSVLPFGRDLTSNHLGIVAELSLSPPSVP